GLAAERGALEDAPKQRDLPLTDAVRPPLPEDLVDLCIVDDAGEVAAALVHDLHEGREDRAGREHGRGDANALLRLADVLRDPMRERFSVLRAEPGPKAGRADLFWAGIDAAGV